MGQQYQDTINSFAASPQAMDQQQATQTPGNNTPGKSLEQSPMHDGFGTRSSMYDNGMDVSAQPAPVAMPPQPTSQPSSAGITPSWAQQPRKRGGRTKRADGGPLAAFGSMADQPYSMMRTGDTIKAFGDVKPMQAPSPTAAPVQAPAQQPSVGNQSAVLPDNYSGQYEPVLQSVAPRNLTNADFLNTLYQQDFGRAPDAGGLSFWSDLLGSGKMNQQQVEQMFLNSAEGQQKIPGILAEMAKQANTPEARQRMLAQGIVPDQPGTVDPFISGYNARMANAQGLYGSIAQQNAMQNTADQGQYQQELDKIQAANQQRLAAAQQAKADRQAREAEAARQQQLMLMMMMMGRR